MQVPETRFVTVDGDRIAYQVFGAGPVDCLLLMHFGTSVDGVWEHPGHLRIWEVLTRRMRIILLDHRGTGMSDSLPDELVADLDLRVDDALAVLDEVGSESAFVWGQGDGSLTAIELASRHPQRVGKLLLENGCARLTSTPGHPFGLTVEETDRLADRVHDRWGRGEVTAATAPHLAGDEAFLSRHERLGARPRAIRAGLRNLARVDVCDRLATITAPVLVVHSGDFPHLTVEHSEYLAGHLPGSQFVRRSSSSHYWGDGAVDAIVAFATGEDARATSRELLTLLFTDVVSSTAGLVDVGDTRWHETLDILDGIVATRAARFGGRVIKQTGDGHLVEFARPGDAIRAGRVLRSDAATLDLELRLGVHTGEVERREDGDVGGLTVHIAARVAAAAPPGQILVTRTVTELVGADHRFTEAGQHDLKGVPGTWLLYSVHDR